MSKEYEERLEELLDEMSELSNQDKYDISDEARGQLVGAKVNIANLLERMKNTRHLNEWYD